MKIIVRLFIALLVFSAGHLVAQDTLSLEEAVRIGIQQNLGLEIARKTESIAANNASRAAAGQLPVVGLNSNAGYRSLNTMLEFSSPGIEPVDVRGAGTFTFGGSLDASYVVFEGFRKGYQYDRLQLNSQLTRRQTRIRLEGLVYQVLQTYASIQAAASFASTAEKAVAISRERLERAEEALRFGTGSSLTVMEAEVALHQDSARWSSALLQTRVQKRALNRLLQRDPETDFHVEGSIPLDNSLDREALLEAAFRDNETLISYQEQLRGAQLDEKIAGATLWPRVTANAGYAYNRQNNDAGLILNQSTLGPSVGLGLNFPIYDGGLRQRQIENARLARESAELGELDYKLQLELDIHNAWDNYQLALEQLQREENNVSLAESVLERTAELVNLGQLGQLDFRTAQLNVQRSRDVLVTYRLQARQAELELMRLSGQLVQ